MPPIGKSDHDEILYDTSLQAFWPWPRPQRRQIHRWKKANTQGIKEDVKAYSQSLDNKGPVN